MQKPLSNPGLYRPEFERDSCGFGLIAQMDGVASHELVTQAVEALKRMTHRGAIAADGKTGDGCGLLMKKPDRFLRRAAAAAGIKVGENYCAANVFLSPGCRRGAARGRAVVDAACVDGGTACCWAGACCR